MNTKIKTIAAIACSVIAIGMVQQASAQLVQNGGFEFTSGTVPGQVSYNATLTDWSVPAPNGSYTFVYTPGSADTAGANGEYGNVAIWGPNNGSANGLPAASPAGGNYIASDPQFQNGAISQTVSGLTVGDTYDLAFYWAGAQQQDFYGPTTEGWQASLGAQTQSTPTVSIGSQGFSGWMSESFDYTATSTSEVLSFLATGGPNGSVPPFCLLDGVSMTQVTTPDSTSTSVLLGLAVSAMGFAARCRRQVRK